MADGRLTEHEAREDEQQLADSDEATRAEARWLAAFTEVSKNTNISDPPARVRRDLETAFEKRFSVRKTGEASAWAELARRITATLAFDSDSQGSWGAAKGTKLPTDNMGGYSCTWGEFDFGNSKNSRDLPDGHTWSGWDVSAIQAQNANQDVQGMKICQHSDRGCSSISNLAKNVVNAYTAAEEGVDGIGGNYKGNDGVRLHVTIDFDE